MNESNSLGGLSAWQLTSILGMIKCEVRIGGNVRNIKNFFAKKAWIVNLKCMIGLEGLEVMDWRHYGSLCVVSYRLGVILGSKDVVTYLDHEIINDGEVVLVINFISCWV